MVSYKKNTCRHQNSAWIPWRTSDHLSRQPNLTRPHLNPLPSPRTYPGVLSHHAEWWRHICMSWPNDHVTFTPCNHVMIQADWWSHVTGSKIALVEEKNFKVKRFMSTSTITSPIPQARSDSSLDWSTMISPLLRLVGCDFLRVEDCGVRLSSF